MSTGLSFAGMRLGLITPVLTLNRGAVPEIVVDGTTGFIRTEPEQLVEAVELLDRIHAADAANNVPADLLALDSQVTDCNAAIFDVANDFHGVIAGCHEILRRQGLLEGIWCLDPNETLGPGQKEEIDRVCAAYPHLNDDDFVLANLDRWLA